MAGSRRGGSDDDGDVPDAEDVVGADWLLEQLNDGHTERADASKPAESDAAEPDSAAPEDLRTPPKARWSWQSGTVEPIAEDEAGSGSAGPQGAAAPQDAIAATGATPSSADTPEGTAGFSWGLAPTDDPDPLAKEAERPAPYSEVGELADAMPEPPATPTVPWTVSAPPPPVAPAVFEATEAFDVPPPAEGEQPLTRRAARAAEAASASQVVSASGAADDTSGDPFGGLFDPTSAEPTPSGTVPLAAQAPVARVDTAMSAGSGGGRRMDRNTRILVIVAGGLLVVLVLILLFVLGTRLSAGPSAPVSSPTRTATHTPTPTPTPTAPATPKSAAAPGIHPWDALGGGECLQPFTSPWAQNFTVVACTTPHAAQLVLRGSFTTASTAAFPGTKELSSQMNLLCTKPGVINLSAAGSLNDIQVQGAYPATAEQWESGQRAYFCFVNRSSGKPITGSLAG